MRKIAVFLLILLLALSAVSAQAGSIEDENPYSPSALPGNAARPKEFTYRDKQLTLPKATVTCAMTMDYILYDWTFWKPTGPRFAWVIEHLEQSKLYDDEKAFKKAYTNKLDKKSQKLDIPLQITLRVGGLQYALRLEPYSDGRMDIALHKGESYEPYGQYYSYAPDIVRVLKKPVDWEEADYKRLQTIEGIDLYGRRWSDGVLYTLSEAEVKSVVALARPQKVYTEHETHFPLFFIAHYADGGTVRGMFDGCASEQFAIGHTKFKADTQMQQFINGLMDSYIFNQPGE